MLYIQGGNSNRATVEQSRYLDDIAVSAVHPALLCPLVELSVGLGTFPVLIGGEGEAEGVDSGTPRARGLGTRLGDFVSEVVVSYDSVDFGSGRTELNPAPRCGGLRGGGGKAAPPDDCLKKSDEGNEGEL